MADADLKVSVSIEASLHRSLRDVLQSIANEHGVCVTRISAEWTVAILVNGTKQSHLRGLSIESES